MEIIKSFIVDNDGEVQSVILDYKSYQKIEELLLDYGLLKATEEVAEDEEVDLEEAKLQLHFTDSPESPPAKKKLTKEEGALQSRKEITVEQAHGLFRKSVWTDEDLVRKSGMSKSSVYRFWRGDLPKNGTAWRGIAAILERILVEHVRIKPYKDYLKANLSEESGEIAS